MKFNRKASANWKGTGKEGKGSITTESKALDTTQYSFKTRFEELRIEKHKKEDVRRFKQKNTSKFNLRYS